MTKKSMKNFQRGKVLKQIRYGNAANGTSRGGNVKEKESYSQGLSNQQTRRSRIVIHCMAFQFEDTDCGELHRVSYMRLNLLNKLGKSDKM